MGDLSCTVHIHKLYYEILIFIEYEDECAIQWPKPLFGLFYSATI